MIDRHWEGIASYRHLENKVRLGLVEGLTNKIRVLQRRAYGYRDEDYLKLTIIAAFLPPLTRSAEKDSLSPAEIKNYKTLIKYSPIALSRLML